MLKCDLCGKESEVVYGFILYRYGGNYFTTKVNGIEHICKDCLVPRLATEIPKRRRSRE